MLIKNKIEEKIKNLSKPRKTLPQKMVQGGAFISSLKIIQKVLSLIRLVVIGRILAPSDFGLMGIPLVAFNVDGVSEIVKDNNNGFLIRPRDVEQLAKRIIQYIDHKELLVLHGKNGRELIKEKWSIEGMVDKIDKIYQDLIQEKIKK